MPFSRPISPKLAAIVVSAVLATVAGVAYANHAWGPPYHWARTSNPFTLKLGDNVSSTWDAYLAEASSDWSRSSVLDTTVVTGSTSPRRCRPKSGRVEVCNYKYGNTGWLGVAQIWITGGEHITQGVVKLNDTYHNNPPYNTAAWRRFVMCQEVGHQFGLNHQNENFYDPNLGTCMDYTSGPGGPPSNEHPNQHDYDMLQEIYAHLDSSTTLSAASPWPWLWGQPASASELVAAAQEFRDEIAEWGQVVRLDGKGRPSLYVRDLGRGEQVFTFVIWANEKTAE